MEGVKPLHSRQLANQCDSESFEFRSSSDITTIQQFIGQKRAYEAIQFGIRIKHDGYNLYALGPDDVGKHAIINSILEAEALTQAIPDDWCYVYNFKDHRRPLAMRLPAGVGQQLQSQMHSLIEELQSTLMPIFETDDHHARIKQINEEMTLKEKKYFDSLQEQAEQHEMTILSTSKGFVVVPQRGGKVLTPKDLKKLSDKEQAETEEITEELNEQLEEIIGKIQRLHKDARLEEKEFEKQYALQAVRPLIEEIRENYASLPQVLQYLDAVQEDILNNLHSFLKEDEQPTSAMWGESHPSEFAFSRYQVNVIIDNANTRGAPIVYEDNPRDYKLIGRIEHVSQMGALVTDFTLIRPGALHRANGGYLIIDTEKILEQTWSWEALKRALLSKEIKIELPPNLVSVTSTSTLEPEPIPLDIKVILIGNRGNFYHLSDDDDEFNDLFKVPVDFEENIHRTDETILLFAELIASLARKKNIRPIDRQAIARIIDHCSRVAEDAEKISLNRLALTMLLEESDHWANEAKHPLILREDVQRAIDCQKYRLDYHQQQHYEDIKRDILLIETQGKRISQINGLTTFRFGDFVFGIPSRITATTRIGREGIIDIEREVNLSGPIHSKGMMILSGFFRGRYAKECPLSLSASIVFEQSYCPVDGDSASVAELCALISSLSKIPINQNLAVTGSVNQHGLVQAIGCVNQKIEGFFEICQSRGLTGNQGVLIPLSNVKNLMLCDDVIQAAKEGKFHIYPVATIDQAMTLLMDMPAGDKDQQGHYRENTLNYLVEKQLKKFARINKKWTKGII